MCYVPFECACMCVLVRVISVHIVRVIFICRSAYAVLWSKLILLVPCRSFRSAYAVLWSKLILLVPCRSFDWSLTDQSKLRHGTRIILYICAQAHLHACNACVHACMRMWICNHITVDMSDTLKIERWMSSDCAEAGGENVQLSFMLCMLINRCYQSIS